MDRTVLMRVSGRGRRHPQRPYLDVVLFLLDLSREEIEEADRLAD